MFRCCATTRDPQPVPRTHQLLIRLPVDSGNSLPSLAVGGPHTFILPCTVQGCLNIALIFVARSLLGIVPLLSYKEDHALVRMHVCASHTATPTCGAHAVSWDCVLLKVSRDQEWKQSLARDRGHLQDTSGVNALLSLL